MNPTRNADAAAEAEDYFFAQCPDPRAEPVLASGELDGVVLLYFEDVQTIATLRAGHRWGVRFPQVVVVLDAEGVPERMVRIEEDETGERTLCLVGRDGTHVSFGPLGPTDAPRFLAVAAEILRGEAESAA